MPKDLEDYDVDLSNAVHLQGNAAHQKGDYHGAIELYRKALKHYPLHIFAWHDVFVAYNDLARRGEVHVHQMRVALDMVKKLEAGGVKGPGAKQIARLEALLQHYEKAQG